MRFTSSTTSLDIDAEVDWPDGPPWDAETVNEFSVRYAFAKDALWLTAEAFMEKWKITKIYRLGRRYCGNVYYDAVAKRWLEGKELDAVLQQTGCMVSS